MRTTIYICFHSVKIEKVLETDNGEILHREFPTGALRHDSWFHELDRELQAQIIQQAPELSLLPNASHLVAA